MKRLVMITLHGMTWNHPRGYDPLVAASAAFSTIHPDVRIEWARRSLQDFEHFPVEVLAEEFDLIVIDHPHIGGLADAGVLLPFGGHDDTALQDLARNSVGPSFASYTWSERQWALPIDAASQVQAWRPDLMDGPAQDWGTVVSLARQGGVIWPWRSPHELMSFMTLAANIGTPCNVVRGPLLGVEEAMVVLDFLRELTALVPAQCRDLDPIAALELMASDDTWAVAPLVYGYVSYSRDGFRPKLLKFADIPPAGRRGPIGSVIGGTGLAVSAKSAHPQAALNYALFVASENIQKGLYAESGGQPGHRAAWLDAEVNRDAHDFYRATLSTLDGVWLRPRHDGYIDFQNEGAALVSACLGGQASTRATAERLNDAFARSFERTEA
jgi:multiple sugar transport system substrate-binding protein